MPFRQLLTYRFGSDSRFEGQLVGALERIESGGAMRVLDALFVARAPETGDVTAVALSTDGSGGIIGQLLAFRLDERERQAATSRALEGANGEAVHALADRLVPGNAVAAVIVQHVWADALEDAVARIGGTGVANEFVDTDHVSDLADRLLTAAEENG
jgi:hypothetical protein